MTRLVDINADSSRFIRSEILRTEVARMQHVLRDLHFDQGLHVTKDEIHVEFEGIFLSAARSTRYYKVPRGRDGNEGKALAEFLADHNIVVNSMVDLGANFGEISLYFAKNFPEASILAIEASPENYSVLQENIATQFFRTENITAINKAVSDKPGEINITAGMGSENTILFNENFEKNYRGYERGMEKVAADTLVDILSDHNVQNIDFLKVDIEGAEPLLYESLDTLLAKIRAIYIEVSWRNDAEKYLRLLRMIYDRSDCYTADGAKVSTFELLESRIHALDTKIGFDLWFLPNSK